MNNISVTPKGGTIATEVSGNQVNLTAPSVVKLNLNQADIKSFTRNGSDLVVTTKSGEVVVIHKFYDANGDSDLVLQDDKGALWWVEDPGTEGFQFMSIDSTEGLLAENVTGDGTLTAFGIAGAALAGIGALIAGNNGGGGGDTTAPAAVSDLLITDNAGSVQGAITGGTSTDDNTPTLSGTAEAGTIVSIYDGTTLLGSTIADGSGQWRFTPATLADGNYAFRAVATDAAGNVTTSVTLTVTIDTVAPGAATLVVTNDVSGTVIPNGGVTSDTTPPVAITGLAAVNNNGSTPVAIAAGGVTNDSTPRLSGTAEANSIVTIRDGDTVLGSVTEASNGSWSFVVGNALSNGSHTLNVTQTDPAGNVSPQVSTTLIVDTVVPVASTLTIIDDISGTPVTLANGAFTRDTTPTLRGTTEAGAVVTIYDGASAIGSVTAGSDGSWSFTTATLANGAHTLSTTVTDAAGNVSTGNITATVNVDTLPPAAVSGLAINSAGTLVTGSGEVGATVTVRDASGNALGTTTVGNGGNWSVTLTTAQITGAPLSVIQTDRAGNVSPGASLTGAIRIVATNDSNEVDYTSTQATVNNGNAYLFSVGNDDSRTVTLNVSVTSLGVAATYSLNQYEQRANGSWQLISIKTNYISALLTIGTLKGGKRHLHRTGDRQLCGGGRSHHEH